MVQRYFTKTLRAAAIVIMAIGALGQDVLAGKPLPPPDFCTTTLTCSSEGFVVADQTTRVTAGLLETQLDTHTGHACFLEIREYVAFIDMHNRNPQISAVTYTETDSKGRALILNLSSSQEGCAFQGQNHG